MNMQEREKVSTIITEWYRHFGINYVFHRVSASTPYVPVCEKDSPAASFGTLDALHSFITKTDVCGLKGTSRNTVFADGSPTAEIMIIGEAPGEEEDIQGKPFVGQSGLLLNNMLKSVGLDRKDTYITNILFWRPPANRTPSTDEITKCLPYVRRHIELVSPKVILLLGGVAIKAIMNSNGSISSLRGQALKYNETDVIATFHPAYLLRSPSQKFLSFLDMIKLRKLL
jgi:DNA polymerase